MTLKRKSTKRKPGLALSRHVQVGAFLKAVRNDLVTLAVEIGNAYPTTGKRGSAWRYAQQAVQDLDALRSALGGNLFHEYPDAADVNIYGGAPESPAPSLETQWAQEK